jgi:sulfatase modifying factor 1
VKRVVSLAAAAAVGLVTLSAGSERVGCPRDMAVVGESCVDRYEWPNRRGAKPLLGASGLAEPEDIEAGKVMDATRLCASVGKRVCRREEWVAACRGPTRSRYPFGDRVPRYDPNKRDGLCNYDRWFRTPNEHRVAIRDPAEMIWLDQSEPAGSRETCRSDYGVYDLMGNAEEWVRCGAGDYGWCLMGRYWSAPRSCGYTVTRHSPKWHYYQSGFRCCKDRENR